MCGKDAKGEELAQELARDYAEKIFYFCLKKTGEIHQAEDLSSDILLNLIGALRRGAQPRNFPGWVWQIARNRYSLWAWQKHVHSRSVAGADVGEYELEDESPGPEEAWMKKEELAWLRGRLAFLSSDYRNILVAYYFEEKRIGQIAKALGLPEGTVTSKLHRARKKLKEGMNMAREFGERSFRPENISFVASGNQPSGLPWSAIQRRIPVNILCEANNNPSTLEELALALGIALPYMEEETERLVQAQLLKKTREGKYLTGFFISPKECQEEFRALACAFAREHDGEFWRLAGACREKAAQLGVTWGGYSDDDVQMFFAFLVQQRVEGSVFPENICAKFERADGGNWGLMGLEEGAFDGPLPAVFFNNNGMGGFGKCLWDGYQTNPGQDREGRFSHSRYAFDTPEIHLLVTLQAVARGRREAEFSQADRTALARLLEEGFCVRDQRGKLAVNGLVFQWDQRRLLMEWLCAQPEYEALRQAMEKLARDAERVMARYANPYLKEDFDYYVMMSLGHLRSVLACLWKDGGLYRGEEAQFCALYC